MRQRPADRKCECNTGRSFKCSCVWGKMRGGPCRGDTGRYKIEHALEVEDKWGRNAHAQGGGNEQGSLLGRQG